jgi:two-component system sensor histidine kinase RpfC
VAALAERYFAAVLPVSFEETALANALRTLPSGASDEGGMMLPETPPSAPAKPRRKLRVLVAEDNHANRKIIQRILEMVGHEVHLVNDGEAALNALDEGDFDAALLDINMPEMSGYEATKLYRMTHLDGKRLPIIALTADATGETERLCRDAGMDAVLTKPVEPERLLAVLESAVQEDGVGAAKTPAGGEGGLRPATVTPISSHPKYETGGIVDENAIDALRSLGGSDFFDDVIDTFRSDARGILDYIAKAVASADVRAFKEHAHSLRSSAANVGGARLCQALLSLREVSAKELRQDGAAMIEKLNGEFERLDAALEQKVQEAKRG